ncbi:MAG TPA: DUF418 domain-containing protein [Microlunatus sp.]|nr:DUF418 domain-containing protein [Microlunatus sp.]
MATLTTPKPAALTSSSRALAPDLARGLMLLLIALANTPWYLYGTSSSASSIHSTDGSTLDRIVQFVIITAVDMRIYPMFAFLFGYGIVQMYQRSIDRGAEPISVRRVLRRRHLWMIVIGFLHAALLWMGDIVGAYGLVGLIFTAAFLKRKNKTIVIWASVFTGLLTVLAVLAVIASIFAAQEPPPPEAMNFLDFVKSVNGIESWPQSILPRLGVWSVLLVFQGLLTLVVPIAVLLGFWAARHRVLEQPDRHHRLLLTVAVVGLAVGWIGGAVHALEHLGVLPVPEHVSWVFSTTQPLTGLLGGLGYIALFGLIAAALRRRSEVAGPITTSVTAVGKRSLSSYLAQSVICAPLLCAWGLGLGAVLGSAATAALAVGVWLVTVVGCAVLERRGLRGPAEWLLRRLAYGRAAES